MRRYQSWGRYPEAVHTRVIPLFWRSDLPALDTLPVPVLPFAYGRSYGDSCLNDGAALLDVAGLDRLIAFDDQDGILRCEAGVTLAQTQQGQAAHAAGDYQRAIAAFQAAYAIAPSGVLLFDLAQSYR